MNLSCRSEETYSMNSIRVDTDSDVVGDGHFDGNVCGLFSFRDRDGLLGRAKQAISWTSTHEAEISLPVNAIDGLSSCVSLITLQWRHLCFYFC